MVARRLESLGDAGIRLISRAMAPTIGSAFPVRRLGEIGEFVTEDLGAFLFADCG